VVDGVLPDDPDEAAHLGSCLSCQAELARYRRLARLLAQLRDERAELPPGLLNDVLATVERAARSRARPPGRIVLFVLGGAAAAATVVGMVLGRHRRRPTTGASRR
jgi:predicted anti-sigma-YlaC factor YlaD